MALSGLAVQRPCRHTGLILPSVALLWAHMANGTVAVLHVVPTHEFSSPGAGTVHRINALRRQFRAALGRAGQRLCKRASSLNRGRDYEGLMPSQLSMASTVVAFRTEPL